MKIELLNSDITVLNVDAIVNAANESLLGGGGVDGAIHRAAGDELLRECQTLHGCATGQAKITGAYQLPCRFVIHTVGPVWRGGDHQEAALLASSYTNCFALVLKKRISTIAFPAISTGIYGFPKEQAAQIAVAQTIEAGKTNTNLVKVIFTCFNKESRKAYENAMQQLKK